MRRQRSTCRLCRTQHAEAALNAKLGPGASLRDVVALLDENVIATAPNATQASLHVSMIEAGQYTPASLAFFAAGTDLNASNIDFVGLAAHGARVCWGLNQQQRFVARATILSQEWHEAQQGLVLVSRRQRVLNASVICPTPGRDNLDLPRN